MQTVSSKTSAASPCASKPDELDKLCASGNSPAYESGLAQNYRGLENHVCSLRSASVILEAMQDDALVQPQEVSGGSDLLRFDLTRDQWNALSYIAVHVGNLTRDLYALYYAGFDKARGEAEEARS